MGRAWVAGLTLLATVVGCGGSGSESEQVPLLPADAVMPDVTMQCGADAVFDVSADVFQSLAVDFRWSWLDEGSFTVVAVEPAELWDTSDCGLVWATGITAQEDGTTRSQLYIAGACTHPRDQPGPVARVTVRALRDDWTGLRWERCEINETTCASTAGGSVLVQGPC